MVRGQPSAFNGPIALRRTHYPPRRPLRRTRRWCVTRQPLWIAPRAPSNRRWTRIRLHPTDPNPATTTATPPTRPRPAEIPDTHLHSFEWPPCRRACTVDCCAVLHGRDHRPHRM